MAGLLSYHCSHQRSIMYLPIILMWCTWSINWVMLECSDLHFILNNAKDFRQGSIITRYWHIATYARQGGMAEKALITNCKHKETAFPDSSHCSFALTLLRVIVSALNRNEKEGCWEEKLVSLFKSVLVWIKEENKDAAVN